MRLERYVIAMPSAIRAVSPPTITPRKNKPAESGKNTSCITMIAAAGASDRATDLVRGHSRRIRGGAMSSCAVAVNGPPGPERQRTADVRWPMVRLVKVDGGITFDLAQSGQSAREAEAAGY